MPVPHLADRRFFSRVKARPPCTAESTVKDALNRKMSGFDWPRNIPAALPPQRLSYKQRLGWMRQGVVGGRFLHTISSGWRLWKTRTNGCLKPLAIARRNAKETPPPACRRARADSGQPECKINQGFRLCFAGLPISATRSSNRPVSSCGRVCLAEVYLARTGWRATRGRRCFAAGAVTRP